MNASAYIQNGILCVVGTHSGTYGEIPFSCSVEIQGESTDGPVDVGSELPPNIESALQQVHDSAMQNVTEDQMKLAVRDVVLRARVGDQNAIATIVETKKAASRSPQARKMLGLLIRYIKNNPVTDKVSIGNEAIVQKQLTTTIQKALIAPSILHYGVAVVSLIPSSKTNPIILLANGPELDEEHMTMILQALPENQRDSVIQGTCKLGYCVAQARRIQNVRNGQASISSISPMAGYEFGE